MKFILYKNCVFHGDYKEVINKRTMYSTNYGYKDYMEKYLESLQNQEFEVDDDVYLSNSGSIPLQINQTSSIANKYFNYMVVIDSLGKKRYYFIENCTIINDSLVIVYNEDIWNNYTFNVAYGRRTKILDLSKYNTIENDVLATDPLDIVHNLPIPYESNKQLVLHNEEVQYFNIVVTLQLYKTAVAGTNITDRYGLTMCLGTFSSQTNSVNLPIGTTAISDLVKHQSDMKFIAQSPLTTDEFSYSISNIYLIPSTFGLVVNDTTCLYKLGTTNVGLFFITSGYLGELSLGTEYEIDNDFKITSVGLIGKNAEINPNGKKIKLQPMFSYDEYTFTILLNICGNIIDVSKELNLQVPISAQSYETSQELRYEQNSALITSAIGLVGDIIKAKSGSFNLGNTANNISGEIKNLLPLHSTSQSVKIENNSAYLNAVNGICYWTLNPDNETEVENAISIEGYTINEFVKFQTIQNAIDNNLPNKYDIIKYDNLVVDGNVPELIRKRLEDIFKKGFRFYYRYQDVREEVYV